ncbi:MAG: O-antigen ligase family protein, partial [Bdellovibrionales bacterium]|nr:O-antigen ligase family protein [Bdellovibrionales bacterium]
MSNYLLRFVFVAPLLCLTAAISAAEIRPDPPYLFLISAAVAAGGFFSAVLGRRIAFGLLGTALCLLPMLGAGSLSLFVALWLLGSEVKDLAVHTPSEEPVRIAERFLLLGFLALLLSLLCSLVQAVILEADFLILSTLFQAGGLGRIVRYAGQSYSQWRAVPEILSGFVLAVFLAFRIVRVEREVDEKPLAALLGGLALSSVGAVFVLLMQFNDAHPLFALNQNAFWQMVGRYSASFSDPNAFGIMAALLIPLLMVAGRGLRAWLFRSAAVLLLIVTPWSGSRTVWFGLLLWLLLLFTGMFGVRSTGALRSRGFLLVFAGFLGLAFLGFPPLNEWLDQQVDVPGLDRVLKTMHWQKGGQMLSSRLIYGRIALAMWEQSPLIGVGLDRFYGLQEITARSIGIALEDWRDNANNYYLQVLAEQGLIGVALTLLAFYLFALALSGRPLQSGGADRERTIASTPVLLLISRLTMGVLALLLLTGPHFFFDEVRFLAVIILGIGVSQVESVREKVLAFHRSILLVATLVCPIIYSLGFANASSTMLTRGF